MFGFDTKFIAFGNTDASENKGSCLNPASQSSSGHDLRAFVWKPVVVRSISQTRAADMRSTWVEYLSNTPWYMLHITRKCYKHPSNMCYGVVCMRWKRAGTRASNNVSHMWQACVWRLSNTTWAKAIRTNHRHALDIGCTCFEHVFEVCHTCVARFCRVGALADWLAGEL